MFFREYSAEKSRTKLSSLKKEGGIEPYCFLRNNPLGKHDILGLTVIDHISVLYDTKVKGNKYGIVDGASYSGDGYEGTLCAFCKPVNKGGQPRLASERPIGCWPVHTGGVLDDESALDAGSFTGTPEGTSLVDTTPIGSVSGYLMHKPGTVKQYYYPSGSTQTQRSWILIHGPGASSGCTVFINKNDWIIFDKHMKDTSVVKSSIPSIVKYIKTK